MKLLAAPKNLSDAIKPLMTLNYLTGLRLFKYTRGKLRTVLNLIYLLLLIGIYCKSKYMEDKFYNDVLQLLQLESALYQMIMYVNALVVVYEVVFGCFCTKKLNECYQRVSQIDETLRQLGAMFNYSGIYILTICSIIVWFLYSIMIGIMACVLLTCFTNLTTIIWLIVSQVYIISISFFVIFEFSIFVKCLQTKFKLVNALLSDGVEMSSMEVTKLGPFAAEDDAKNMDIPKKRQNNLSIKVLNRQLQSRVQTLMARKRNLIRSRIRSRLSSPLKNQFQMELQGQSKSKFGNPNPPQRPIAIVGCRKQKHLLQTIRQVHLELCKVSKTLCTNFGMQIILEIGTSIIFITGFLYDLYGSLLLQRKHNVSSPTLQIVTAIMLLSTYVLKIILINRVCKIATNEGKKTNEIIYSIYGCCEDIDIKEEIQQFGLQILQSPVEFFAFGISLNYDVLCSGLKTVTTYLVIMIQMGNSLESISNSQKSNSN